MKTDTYTKTILTFIAIFLAVLSFDKVYNAFVSEAQASTAWSCYDSGNMKESAFSTSTMTRRLRGYSYATLTEFKGGLYVCMR